MSSSVDGEHIDQVLQIVSENYDESFRCAFKPGEGIIFFVILKGIDVILSVARNNQNNIQLFQ